MKTAPAPRRGLSRPSASTAPTTSEPPTPSVEAPVSAPETPTREAAPNVAAPERYGRFTVKQWVGAGVVTVVGIVVVVTVLVVLARWLRSLPSVTGFLAEYPGEYPLPEGAPVGLPAWLGWQHFFNLFFMVLIIRSGLQIRREQRPAAFWSPKWNPSRKISLSIWFHQSLDLLWLINGVVFVVLLFATGQWMRVVPTSWDVFPNAASALLQYVSLDWPTENGWVNYNSLQQLAYFTTIFLAAPLAVVSGVRMSGLWPTRAKTLSRIYPVEVARAVHFPVMLYFVAFIVVHVALVLTTGDLRNLNHIYASQDVVNWTGFWLFVLSLAVVAGAWVAARPIVLAPIANLFGKVSSR